MTAVLALAGASLAYYLYIRHEGLRVRDTFPPFIIALGVIALFAI